jgi:hypothetical protein
VTLAPNPQGDALVSRADTSNGADTGTGTVVDVNIDVDVDVQASVSTRVAGIHV